MRGIRSRRRRRRRASSAPWAVEGVVFQMSVGFYGCGASVGNNTKGYDSGIECTKYFVFVKDMYSAAFVIIFYC